MVAPVQSWADEVEVNDNTTTETVDANGVITTISFKTNEQGVSQKITRKTKKSIVKTKVNHLVAERMNWTKFGAERNHKSGPDSATTVVGENVRLKLQPGGIKNQEEDDDKDNAMRQKLLTKKINCRLCQGEHFTTRCPYKDTLNGVMGEGDSADISEPTNDLSGLTPSEARAAGGKYVPPSMRAGAKTTGESMNHRGGNRDDLPTLRVTNLSEDATEADLWELFARFGRVNRIYVGKDQDTGLCKGFAFVSFDDRSDAEKAMKKIDGLPYDHLILSAAFSIPKAVDASK